MNWKFLCASTALLTLSLSLSAQAADKAAVDAPVKAAAPAVQGYVMPSTEVWDMRSDSGEVYRIMVSYPETEAPPEGFPVLYVLDGNALFASFAETRRIQEFYDVGKAIVVGVGYPTDKAYDNRRLFDLTSDRAPPPPWDKDLGKMRRGGRDLFLSFLTGKLRAEIGRRFKINPDRQALFGHSLGGMFALHALYSRPDAFHAIIAASPSIFWHGQDLLREEEEFAARIKSWKISRVSRLLVVAGDREEAILERWDAEDFAKRMELLSAYGLRVRSEIYVGEGHLTVPSRAVSETLRFAFSWP